MLFFKNRIPFSPQIKNYRGITAFSGYNPALHPRISMDRMRPSEGCDVGSIPAGGTKLTADQPIILVSGGFFVPDVF